MLLTNESRGVHVALQVCDSRLEHLQASKLRTPIAQLAPNSQHGVPQLAEHLDKRLQDALRRAARKAAGPLVVIVDELDRCRPAYALGFLEVARHLLAVNGIVVVVATNRTKLCHSIEGLYGKGFGADRYLRRFADVPIVLPAPEDPYLYGYLESLLEDTGLNTRFGALDGNPCPEMLRLIADDNRFSFRDLEQAVQYSAVVLASLPHPSEQEGQEDEVARFSERLAVPMIVLRTLDKEAYDRLASDASDVFETAAALSNKIGENPAALNDVNAIHTGNWPSRYRYSQK